MQQHRILPADLDLDGWHWLIDAIATETAEGSPLDPKALIARIAARLAEDDANGFGPYLPAMFTDPD